MNSKSRGEFVKLRSFEHPKEIMSAVVGSIYYFVAGMKFVVFYVLDNQSQETLNSL